MKKSVEVLLVIGTSVEIGAKFMFTILGIFALIKYLLS